MQAESVFPLPPPAYKKFTAENLRVFHEKQEDEQLESSFHIFTPPKEPTDGKFSVFGQQRMVAATANQS